MGQAKIAILLATYNGGEYLRQLMDSLWAQTERDWQLLVSDDGSRDDTRKILAEYQRREPDRLRLLEHDRPTGSSKDNFLYLTSFAGEYPYVMYCDQDDVWKPDKIEKTLGKMRETENGDPAVPCLVHTDLAVVDENLRPLHDSFIYSSMLDPGRDQLNHLLIQNVVTGCTVMINHALWELAMLPADASKIVMHDMWLALLAACRGRIGFLPQATILYRQHGDNVVGAKDVRSLRYIASFAGRLKQNSRSLRRCQAQGLELCRVLGESLTDGQRQLLLAWGHIRQKNKLARWATLKRHRIWLLGAKRRLAELILI